MSPPKPPRPRDGHQSRTPSERKELRMIERTDGGQNIRAVPVIEKNGGKVEPKQPDQTEVAQGDLTKSEQEQTAAQQTMMLMPSVEATSGGDLSSKQIRRRYIAIEAVVSTPDGGRYSFQTRKISTRGLFITAASSQVPLVRGMICGIELRGEHRTVSFEARVAQVLKGGVDWTGVGFGFQILSISRPELLALHKLLEETPTNDELEKKLASERRRTIFRWTAVVVLFVVAGAGVWLLRPPPHVAATTGMVTTQPFDELIQSSPGEIIPHRFVSVRSSLPAPTVLDVLVKRGSVVKAGEPIAQVLSARTALRKVEAKVSTLEDALKALQEKSASAPGISDATSKLAAARTELEHLKDAMHHQEILAPFAGVVSETAAQTGDVVAPGGAICELVDVEVLRAAVPFTEADASKVKKGMKARVVTPGKEVDATIVDIGAVVRPYGKGKAVLVEAELVQAEDLRPGSSAKVNVILRERPALAIAEDALTGTGNERTVWVVGKDHRAELRHVTVGSTSKGNAEVLGGITEGEMFVRRPPIDLKVGVVVDPPPETGP